MTNNIGKLTNKQLEEIVLSEIGARRDDVVMRPGIGMDCGAIKIGKQVCVLSTDPITAATENAGTLAVHVCCNDAASAGAEPIGILLTILAPPSSSTDDIKKVVADAQNAANKLNVEIIGGHTEFTDAVNRIVLSATVIGKAEKGKYFNAQGAREFDSIVMTKFAGMEGTAIIAADHADKIKDILTEEEILEAKKLSEEISVVKEGLLARNLPITAMHDVTEGGILGALHEMCTASCVGALINLDKVPVLDVTARICDKLGLDVFRLISSGCMLIAAKNGDAVVAGLRQHGIPACEVGMFTKEAKMAASGGVISEIMPPERDEIYKLST